MTKFIETENGIEVHVLENPISAFQSVVLPQGTEYTVLRNGTRVKEVVSRTKMIDVELSFEAKVGAEPYITRDSVSGNFHFITVTEELLEANGFVPSYKLVGTIS